LDCRFGDQHDPRYFTTQFSPFPTGVDRCAQQQLKDEWVMGVNKEHKEFHAVDMSKGWETPVGYPAGIQQKILSGSLDETGKRGSRSRLLRFAPGVYTTKPFVHDYWEEVYLISGDLTVGNDEKGEGGTAFAPNTYASRPPGAYHGPFKSKNGCMLFEIHYFDPV
jgi:hypothetical protein